MGIREVKTSKTTKIAELILSIILMILAFTWVTVTGRNNNDRHYIEAEKLFQNGDYRKASIELDKAGSMYLGYYELKFDIDRYIKYTHAKELIEYGNYKEAISLLEEVSDVEFNSLKSKQDIEFYIGKKSDIEIHKIKDITGLQDTITLAEYSYGLELYSQGNYKQAIKVLIDMPYNYKDTNKYLSEAIDKYKIREGN